MQPDSLTIHALKKGSREALGELFDQYGPALYGLALRISESEKRAESVVEASFLKLWKNAGSLNPDKVDLFSYLTSIVKNLAAESLVKDEAFDFTSYQHDLTTDTRYNTLFREIDQKHLRIVDLAYLQGLNEEEIEESMNIPAGTVNTRLRNAIKELRKVLKEVEVE